MVTFEQYIGLNRDATHDQKQPVWNPDLTEPSVNSLMQAWVLVFYQARTYYQHVGWGEEKHPLYWEVTRECFKQECTYIMFSQEKKIQWEIQK